MRLPHAIAISSGTGLGQSPLLGLHPGWRPSRLHPEPGCKCWLPRAPLPQRSGLGLEDTRSNEQPMNFWCCGRPEPLCATLHPRCPARCSENTGLLLRGTSRLNPEPALLPSPLLRVCCPHPHPSHASQSPCLSPCVSGEPGPKPFVYSGLQWLSVKGILASSESKQRGRHLVRVASNISMPGFNCSFYSC